MARLAHVANVIAYEKNILETFARATADQISDGMVWYPRAIESLERIRANVNYPPYLADKDMRVIPAICAMLSPRVAWGTNLDATRKLVTAASQGLRVCPTVAGVRKNVSKAWETANDGCISRISGPKVTAFFANLCGDFDRVTLDSWAARAAGIPDEIHNHIDRGRHVDLETAYQNVARMVGFRPAELQAIVWIVARGHGEETTQGITRG